MVDSIAEVKSLESEFRSRLQYSLPISVEESRQLFDLAFPDNPLPEVKRRCSKCDGSGITHTVLHEILVKCLDCKGTGFQNEQ